MNLAFGPLTFALAGMIPHRKEQLAIFQQELRRAGFYRPFALQEFLSIRNALVFGWLSLVLTVIWVAFDPVNDPTLKILGVGLIGFMVCYGLPRLWIQSIGGRRVQRIKQGLPDALDMVTMCLGGGLPLQPALERVSKELKIAHPDVATEFEIICRHSEAHTLDYAVTQFANRIDAPEVRSLSALVSQTDRLGTNVAIALRDYADSVRRAYRQRAEEHGNKASVKMLLPISLCLAPPVYILLMAPAVLELREFMVRENRPGGALSPNSSQNQRVAGEYERQLQTRMRENRLQRSEAATAARAAANSSNPPPPRNGAGAAADVTP